MSVCGEPGDGATAALIQGLVDTAASVAIIGHERPDGDCIGSEVALCSILRAQGKRAEIVNADPTPERYLNLDPDAMIRRHRPGAPLGANLVFVLDSTDLKRIGKITPEEFGGARIVDIDHHPGNPNFGNVNFVDTAAA
ncbi:MAG TPA: DHH family phosphoesterase, partial [Planctomycetota bacterium]|nr:DHH family phosphoesterase [Planctomycetota bacterium]